MEDQIKEEIMMALANNNVASVIDLLKTIESPYLSYDCREDKEKYPKAFQEIKTFLINNSNGALIDLEEDQLEMAIFVNPRMIYDFFDSMNIYVSTVPPQVGASGNWGYINIDGAMNYNNYKNRHEAEKSGISYGISVVEEMLNKSNGTKEV